MKAQPASTDVSASSTSTSSITSTESTKTEIIDEFPNVVKNVNGEGEGVEENEDEKNDLRARIDDESEEGELHDEGEDGEVEIGIADEQADEGELVTNDGIVEETVEAEEDLEVEQIFEEEDDNDDEVEENEEEEAMYDVDEQEEE